MTLSDDEAAPSLSLSLNPSRVSEGAGSTTVSVTAAISQGGALPEAKSLTISVGTSGDGAASGTDYAAVTDFDLTIAAGKTSGSASFALVPTQDSLLEGDETITVAATADALVIAPAKLTLGDDESAPSVSLALQPSQVMEDAGATVVTVTASLGNSAVFAADTAVTVAVGDSQDSASEGTDYSAVADFTVTIPAQQSSGSATFTLTPTADTHVEGSESISVRGAATGLSVQAANLTLADATVSAPLQVEFQLSASPSEVPEAGGTRAITLTASLGSAAVFAEDRQVDVTLTDAGATYGDDYVADAAVTITIPAGQNQGSATMSLTPLDDSVLESHESVLLTGSLEGYGSATAHVTILDDDIAIASVTEAQAMEGQDLQFAVSLSNPADSPVRIAYATADGTATASADYWAAAAELEIPAGATSATVRVGTIDDALPEETETMTFALKAPSGGFLPGVHLRGERSAAVGTILNDDIALLAVAPAEATEGQDLAFSVSMSPAAELPVTFGYRTADGTARAADDYATANGLATIAAGERATTISVATVADEVPESDETLTLALSVPREGLPSWARIDDGEAVGTILNDDFVLLTLEAATAEEGTDLAIEVSLSLPAPQPFDVAYASADYSARAGADYEAATGLSSSRFPPAPRPPPSP